MSDWPDLDEQNDVQMLPDDPMLLAKTESQRAERLRQEEKEREVTALKQLQRETEIERIKAYDPQQEAKKENEERNRQMDRDVRCALISRRWRMEGVPKSVDAGWWPTYFFELRDTPLLHKTNSVIKDWIRNDFGCSYFLPDLSIDGPTLLSEVRRNPGRNPALAVAAERKSRHLVTLLRYCPGLLTPRVLFVIAANGDRLGMAALTRFRLEHLEETEKQVHSWIWTPYEGTSVLQACAGSGQISFLQDNLIAPLQRIVGADAAHAIVQSCIHLPVLEDHTEYIAQIASRQRYWRVLHYLLPFGLDLNVGAATGTAAVQEAARQIETLPTVRKLVQLGCDLEPIWRRMRADRKLAWLRNLILDTFFEQGARCRPNANAYANATAYATAYANAYANAGGSRCLIYKLSSPLIQSLIVKFLWYGLKRLG